MTDLEERFQALMLERVYRETGRQCGYWAHRFRQLVTSRGGVAAAKLLLTRAGVSPGFAVLQEKGRLDLSMEALVLEAQFRELFSDAERAAAQERLESGRSAAVEARPSRPSRPGTTEPAPLQSGGRSGAANSSASRAGT